MNIKEFSFSSFAEWFLNTANQVVKHYKGDILIDAAQIVELRNKHLFNPQRDERQSISLDWSELRGFSLYWGVRETGTWLYHVDGDNFFTLSELKKGLGAKHIYFITYQYDAMRNEIITVSEMDSCE